MLVTAAILIGLALLLVVPLEVELQLDRVEALEGRVSLHWLFGLVRIRVPTARGRPPRPAAEPAASGERARGSAAARGLALLRQPAFRQRVLRLLRELARAIHVRRLRLVVRLGLGDPADTGILWAVLGPLAAAIGSLPRAEVRIEPEFVDAVLELHARGRVWVTPLRIVAVAVGFALSPASIRAWRT